MTLKLLSLDPSSTATGYAVMTDRQTVVDCGLLTPFNRGAHAIDRAACICDTLEKLFADVRPNHTIIEVPSAHLSWQARKHGAEGVTLYAFAAGAQHEMIRRCVKSHNARCQPKLKAQTTLWRVDEREWTKGVPKAKRAAATRLEFSHIRGLDAALADDKGGDVADAIGIAVYWWAKIWKRLSR